MDKEEEVTQNKISLMIAEGKPNLLNMNLRNLQSTLSYAFSKSILKAKAPFFIFRFLHMMHNLLSYYDFIMGAFTRHETTLHWSNETLDTMSQSIHQNLSD